MERENAQAPLDYDRNPVPYITRRNYRLLLTLTILNTVLLCCVIIAPPLWSLGSGQWNSYKAQTAAQSAAQKKANAQVAAQSQCLGHTFGANTVVYEEEPAAIGRLLDTYQYAPIDHMDDKDVDNALKGYQFPVHIRDPQYYNDLKNLGAAGFGSNVMFLHQRKTPSGKPLLVVVHLYAYQKLEWHNEQLPTGNTNIYEAGKARILKAWAYELATPTAANKRWQQYDLLIGLPDREKREIYRDGAGVPHPKPIDYGQRLRLFGGQADPQDASRFSLRYQINDRDGTIDGIITNNSIQLKPREGQVLTNESMPTWKISDADLPAKPVTNPPPTPAESPAAPPPPPN